MFSSPCLQVNLDQMKKDLEELESVLVTLSEHDVDSQLAIAKVSQST